MRTKGRRVQKQVVVILRATELIVLRLKPFVWIYFNVGKREHWKRIAFDFWFELNEQTFGISFEKAIEVRE